jgi:hypothetical protein
MSSQIHELTWFTVTGEVGRGRRDGDGGRTEGRGMREAGGGRERSEVTRVGPAASSRIQAVIDREGTGVDLDLDASEREELRTEARGRRERKERRGREARSPE